MNTCATCRYWNTEPEYHSPEVRVCQRVAPWWNATVWERDSDGRNVRLRAKDSTAKAFAQDGSDYYAALLTMADFGCVMWEAPSGQPE